MNDVSIDHVIVGIADLEVGIRRFAELSGVSMEIHSPQAESLGRLVAELRLGAVVREAAAEEMALTLVCPAGRVRLR